MNENTSGLWGGIASAVSSITNTVINTSPKVRENNLAIAEAQARAAEANAIGGGNTGMDGKTIGIIAVVGVVVIMVVVLLSTKKK